MNQIQARVRRPNAIGIFYYVNFNIMADNLEDAKTEWFEKYGPLWELNHFGAFIKCGKDF